MPDSRTCPHCGSTFVPNAGPGRPRKWCYDCLPAYDRREHGSPEHKAYMRQALALDNYLKFGNHRSCCGTPRTKAELPPLIPCSNCGEPTRYRRIEAEFHTCGAYACKRAWVKHWRTQTPQGKAYAATKSWSAKTKGKLLARDGDRCSLCRKRMDVNAKCPDLKAPTVDHVIPRSAGGTHDLPNLRLACFGCNASKGNRVWGDGEQLALI